MKAGETFDEWEARMRKDIRGFYQMNPVAFRELVDEYEAWAAEIAPKGKEIPAAVYAGLLADWLHAKTAPKAVRLTRDQFIAKAAEKGWRWSDRRGRRHVFANTHTIERALDKAQSMAKRDAKFRQEVQDGLTALRELLPHDRRKM